MRVLLIEDDQNLTQNLVEIFNGHGIDVDLVSTESSIRNDLANYKSVDAIVLDRLLGNFDTKATLPILRTTFPQTPVIVVSAIDTPNERIDLLELGADDYLGKPFSALELVARIKAVSRRRSTTADNVIKLANTTFDLLNRTISTSTDSVELSAKEFLILHTLAKHVGKVWSKKDLLNAVWGQDESEDSNVLEVTIANLRKKITSVKASFTLKNMRFVGYWLEA